MEQADEIITPDWLKAVGFRWREVERSGRHWLLWLGGCLEGGDCSQRPRWRFSSFEDLGIELAPGAWNPDRDDHDDWFCWLRGDSAGLYSRFIHIRHLRSQRGLIRLVEALTDREWDPTTHLYGAAHCKWHAENIRREDERFDRRLMRSRPWSEIEKDPSRAGALPEDKVKSGS